MKELSNSVGACSMIKVSDIRSEREVGMAEVTDLALSIQAQGLLQPICVRPDLTGQAKYVIIFGNHRLAAVKSIGDETIMANILDMGDDEAEAAMLAENLFGGSVDRQSSQFKIDLMRCSEICQRLEDEASSLAGSAPKARKRSKRTVNTDVRLAKKLGEEALTELRAANVPESDLRKLAAVKKDEQRATAVSHVLLGKCVDDAITLASLPPGATVEEVQGTDVPTRSDDELTDDEWLDKHCGEVIARLRYQAAYKADATLYRHARKHMAEFIIKIRPVLDRVRKQYLGQGDLYRRLSFLSRISHPSDWKPCGRCGGTGNVEGLACTVCYGRAYAISTERWNWK